MADLFRRMVAARTYDRKATAMQKQGRLATYAPFHGQEAAQIGATAALIPADWVVGTYRDAAAMWDHGYPWVNLILGRTGDERGGHPPDGVNVLPPSITVGAHMIHAVGIGWASKLRGDDAVAMTFFGDGATSEGDFHEAMNFAGVFATPTVFVCQNNGWAISMPRERQTASETIAQKAGAYGVAADLVDGNDLLAVYDVAAKAVARAREGAGPTLIEALTYRIGPHTTTDDDKRYRQDTVVDEWRRQDPLDRVRAYPHGAGGVDGGVGAGNRGDREPGGRGRRHRGGGTDRPRPGRDLRRHVRRAHRPAADPARRVGGGLTVPERNLAQALNHALDVALAEPDVVLMGEDVGTTGGVFRISDGLQQRHGEDKVIDTPVAESGIVGAAFGMAVAGMRPIVEIQFMGFSYPAYDQVISHVSRIRNRSRHRFTCPMVIRIPYGAGIGAAEHHSESAEAIYVHTPGLKVVVPSTPYDAKGLFLAAVADPDPVVFLEPIRLYRSVKGEVPDDAYEVPLGVADIVADGDDVTLIGYGAMMREIRRAAEVLAEEGVGATVVDLRTLSPLDGETVVEAVRHTGRAVVVHEAPRTGGIGGEIVALIQEHALYDLQAPVARVTGWDTVVPLRRAEQHYVPTTERIVEAARRTLKG